MARTLRHTAFLGIAALALAGASSLRTGADLAARFTTATNLALGDSAAGSIDVLGEVDTFHVTLTAGDTIDVALWPVGNASTSLQNNSVAVFDPAGMELARVERFTFRGDTTRYGYSELDARRVVTSDGTYRIEVSGSGTFRATGTYLLSIRRSGGILLREPATVWVAAAEGGAPVVDTLWLFNAGARPLTWSLAADAPWLTASPLGGTLPPAAPGATAPRPAWVDRESDEAPVLFGSARLAPAGAVPVILTADAAGMSSGDTASAVLNLSSDDSWWDLDADLAPRLKVYDPRISIIAEGLRSVWGIEAHPDGRLIVSTTDETGSSLEYMDSISGARTPWLPGVSPGNTTGISGLTFAPDTVLWVTDNYGVENLSRIFPDGFRTVISYAGGSRESTVAPDGTMYFTTRVDGIRRVDPFGTVTVVDGTLGLRADAIAYHPADGRLYFAGSDGVLRRVAPGGGAVEELGAFGHPAYGMSLGASGYLYVAVIDERANVVVLNTDGDVIEEFYGPHHGGGAAGSVLVCGAVFGTARSTGMVYRLPVDDCPYVAAATNLVADNVPPIEVAAGWQRTVAVLQVDTDDGSAAGVSVTEDADWLSIDPTSGATPLGVAVTVDATGLEPGTYVDTLAFSSEDVANSPLYRQVRITVVEPMLAVGDTVVDTFVEGDERLRFYYLPLTAGQGVDVGAFDDPSSPAFVHLTVEAPDGSMRTGRPRESPDGQVVAAYAATETGIHRLTVRWGAWPSGTGGYVLKTRPAGVVLVSDPAAMDRWLPAGSSSVTDTLWLYNTGPGTSTWEVVGGAPAGVTLGATSGVLGPAGGAPPAAGASQPAPTPPGSAFPLSLDGPGAVTARPPPPGAVPVIVTFDPTELPAGETRGGPLQLRTTDDTWAGDHVTGLSIRALDGAIAVLTPLPYRVMDVLAVSPSELVVTRNRDLWRIDRATGAATLWMPDLGMDAGAYPSPLLGLELAADGALYVADQTAQRIYRVDPDGTSTVAMDAPGVYDPVVLPDGTLVASTFYGFLRRNRDGSVSTVATFQGLKRAVYNPLDGRIWFGTFTDRHIRRVHPETGVIDDLGTVPTVPLDLQVAASGDLYLNGLDGVYVLSPTLEVVQHVALPGAGLGISLGGPGEDVAYATHQGGTYGHIYSIAVADHRAPMPAGPTVRAALEDRVVYEGDDVTIPVDVDLGSTGKAIGSFGAELRWDPSKADFVSFGAGDFSGLFDSNTLDAAEGRIAFAGVSPDEGLNTGVVRVGELVLSTTVPIGETFLVDLILEELAATDFSDLTAGLAVEDGLVRISEGAWGDPGDDRTISAHDAILCLTAVVGGALPEGTLAERCDVAPDVDENVDGTRETFDGTVTALDALAILRHAVELVLPPEYRVGRPR